MAKTEYKVTASHPVDLSCGQMVGPGESTDKVDAENEHDKDLIDRGLLVQAPKAEQKPEPAKTGERKDDK